MDDVIANFFQLLPHMFPPLMLILVCLSVGMYVASKNS